MKKVEIKSKLKEVITRVLLLDCDSEMIKENDLILTYGLNSLDSLEILIEVEEEFGIQVDEDDLDSSLVDSLDNLADYIMLKQNME